jgi:predicted transcriptional regulator
MSPGDALLGTPEHKERIMDLDGRYRVQGLVARPVVYVHVNDSLRHLATTLVEESIGAALVRGPHGAIGLVSERDVTRALAEGANPNTTTVEDIMSDELVTVEPNTDLYDAVHRMLEAEVRHLPVVDDGVATGMVSARDALRALVREHDATMR